MFSLTESVTIAASPGVIWTCLVDLPRWWTASSPDHIRVAVLSPDKSVAEGTGIEFEEQIAGVRMAASGRIVSIHEDSELTWEGTAICHGLGQKISVREGMEWRITSMSGLAIVSANFWVAFPTGIAGKLTEWHATKHLHLPQASREHTRRKLNCLKNMAEMDETAHRRYDLPGKAVQKAPKPGS